MNLAILANLNTITFSALQILLFTLLPYLAETMHISLATVVATFSAGSFLFLWSSPYWAAKSDKTGRQPILIAGLAGLGISTVLLWSLTQWGAQMGAVVVTVILVLSRVIYGLLASAIIPVAQALQVDMSESKSAMKAMISNSMSLNIGRSLGPIYVLLSGGQNMDQVLAGFLLWIVLLIGANLWALRLQSPQMKTAAAQEAGASSWSLAFNRMRWVFLLAILFTSFIGILNSSLAVILKHSFSLSSQDSGVLMAKLLLVSSVIAVVTQFLGRMFFKNPWQGALVIGALTLLVGSVLLQVMNLESQLWTAIVFLSVGIALVPPCYLTLMTMVDPQHVGLGRKAGIVSAANTIGYAVGGAMAALTLKIKLFSLETLLIALVVLMMVSIVVLYRQREVLAGRRK
ncbi:MFS transporter [Bdellovibrio sp. SKB1291214]|uniref:MFS transporter n=1 Tax=Bdellovibrio sp. SKB1291214 TaxID=1732569 RepID=UPI00223FBC97|nr:MFS transporter [Bdellovibrio sp. SKB1291214]UYL07612.1 MFS transporter [Bdellovibrio sp. SKB1291214]